MYNEVFHRCPKCEIKGGYGTGSAQIYQVAEGFGPNIDFSSITRLKERLENGDFSPAELKDSAIAAEKLWLECNNCSRTFQMDAAVLLAAQMLADKFTVEYKDDVQTRAEELLREAYP